MNIIQKDNAVEVSFGGGTWSNTAVKTAFGWVVKDDNTNTAIGEYPKDLTSSQVAFRMLRKMARQCTPRKKK
jgi:hypothetical protein